MTDLQELLFFLAEEEYAAFQAKLTPTVPADRFIGIRVPVLRKFAKDYAKEPAAAKFLKKLPHHYYEENMLHAFLLEQLRDYDACIHAIDAFLPYVDNWAVCDSMKPKVLKKHRDELLPQIKHWAASPHTYTCRFAVELLMSFYLDEAFVPELHEIPAAVRSEEYYVNMMIAWYFATALAKQWDATIPYLTGNRLQPWTHNKTIQKAVESYRITDEQKAYLRTLKVTTR